MVRDAPPRRVDQRPGHELFGFSRTESSCSMAARRPVPTAMHHSIVRGGQYMSVPDHKTGPELFVVRTVV
ncbi:hypothetical protein [Frankia tisae]|uniref:hypothetical protein n=1 Tax=Frankia tisae TaxID=2950104 RepID=UPI0021C24D17|nr:hypothetical protein [Frankia tisae]